MNWRITTSRDYGPLFQWVMTSWTLAMSWQMDSVILDIFWKNEKETGEAYS